MFLFQKSLINLTPFLRQFAISLGAPVILGTLFTAPFTPQILTYHQCDLLWQDPTGIVPQTNNYTLQGISRNGFSQTNWLCPCRGSYMVDYWDSTSLLTCPTSCRTKLLCRLFWTIGYTSVCFDATAHIYASPEGEPSIGYTWSVSPSHNLSVIMTNDTGDPGDITTAQPLIKSYLPIQVDSEGD